MGESKVQSVRGQVEVAPAVGGKRRHWAELTAKWIEAEENHEGKAAEKEAQQR